MGCRPRRRREREGGRRLVWERYWRLSRDPFLGPGTPYVPLDAHEEAVARLVHAIVTGQRSATLRASGGLGKSRILARALAETRGPSRRIATVTSPVDGVSLWSGLSERLGVRVSGALTRVAAWKALGDAVRLCRWQRLQVILAVDDCQDLVGPSEARDLDRLVHLDTHAESRLTVIQVSRIEDEEAPPPRPWDLAIRLPPLTRTEAERYLVAKLAAAGRDEPTFTPRAIHRLHARSGGIPRGIDRLGSLALMAAALRGLEMVTPEVIDGVAWECPRALEGVG